MPLDSSTLSRFWSKVDKSGGSDACWLWQGSLSSGYGVFHSRQMSKKQDYAHRIAYALTHDVTIDSLAGVEICHNCPGGDNPACCNPAHLWRGTHTDNMRDMWSKGRQGDYRAADPPRGSRHPQAKLTEADVRAIRTRHAHNATQRQLAKEYGVSVASICLMVNRKTWTHID